MWVGGRWWSRALLIVVIPVVGLALVAGAWLIDEWRHDGRVVRNTQIDGRPVGGLTEAELLVELADLAADQAVQPVRIDLGDDAIEDAAEDLGVTVDVARTAAAVLRVGRDGSWGARFASWLGSLRKPHRLDSALSLDREGAATALRRHRAMTDRTPVDARVVFDGDDLVVEPAVPGRTLDIDEILTDLGEAIDDGLPVEIQSIWETVPPVHSTDRASRLLADVIDRNASGVIVEADGIQRWIPPKVLFSWMSSTAAGDGLSWAFDDEAMHTYVEELYDDVTVGGIAAAFEIVDGRPVLGEVGDERSLCCGAGAVDAVRALVVGESFGVAELPLRPPSIDESHLAAAQLGIVELVGSFTTNHACCEARVANIHRIADLVRGVVLEPGEQLSINGFVGRRTREGGFVGAGVIEQGRFRTDVGGGISQFATTLFNAAFFAGLDIPVYQSHSIYISRYPYGREATLSFPAPDLVIENATDFAALIWTSYTDTSITVEIYSTAHVVVEELEQTTGRFRSCTRVTTPRQRTFPDGEVVVDEFFATYRPGEGLDCNGNATPTG